MSIRPRALLWASGTVLLLAVPTGADAAKRAPNAAQLSAAQGLRRDAGPAWRLIWNKDLGTPHSMFGGRLKPLPGWSHSRERALTTFMLENADVFGARPGVDEFAWGPEKERAGVHHARLKQTYKGVPVVGGEYAVAVGRDGSLRMINGHFLRDIDVDVAPRVSSSVATDRALASVEGTHLLKDGPTPLVIYRHQGEYRLAYDVTLEGNAGPWRFKSWVDAHTGEIIHSESITPHYTGSGCVHPVDGSSPLSTVALPRLAAPAPGPVYSLNGDYVRVMNVPGAEVTSPDGAFCFPAGDPRTVQVNAYYHTDRMIDYLKTSLGYPGVGTQIIANVNSTPGPANATAWATANQTNFYVGGGSIPNMALAADVIYHETQHVVSWSYGLEYIGEEPQALNEALSDYFAAAMTSDPRIGEWVNAACASTGYSWVNSSMTEFEYRRKDLVTRCQGIHDKYAIAMIVSGAMWDLRSDPAVPDAIADEIILKALDFLPSTPDFGCLADAALLVGFDLYNGQYAMNVLSAFLNRYIWGDPDISIEGPGVLLTGQQGTYTAVSGCDCVPIASYEWYKRPCTPGVGCSGSWVPLGEEETQVVSDTEDFELRVVATNTWSRVSEGRFTTTVYSTPNPTVAITGNQHPNPFEEETYCSVITNGTAPFTHAWSIRPHDVQPPTWMPLHNDPCEDMFVGDVDFDLKVEVTDAEGRNVIAQITVTIGGAGLVATGPSAIEVGRAPVGGSEAVVQLSLAAPTQATLEVIDVSGRIVRRLWDGHVKAGQHAFEWQTGGLPSGVYFYRLKTPRQSISKTFALIH